MKELNANEETGSDLVQVVDMLERSEIDYIHEYNNEEDADDGSWDLDELESYIDVNETVRMSFDEEGNLLGISPIPN